MIKIKFNDSSNMLDVTFSKDSDHVITLQGSVPANSSGFTTWRMNGTTQLGDFSDFTTVYRELENGIQFSNDESVYVEPEPMPEIEYEPIEYTPQPSQLDLLEA